MPLVSEVVHPRGLSFAMQRKVVMLRDEKGMTWSQIRKEVRNLQNKKPGVRTLEGYYRAFSRRDGRVRSKYANCGSKPTKVTARVETLLVQTLRRLRGKAECTAPALQRELARKGTKLSLTWIRKVLKKKGYRWLPKCQKRLYTAKAKAARVAFAKKAIGMGAAGLKERLSMAMDGVVLTVPPPDETDRLNFCKQGDEKMWRKPNEALAPSLAGADPYGKYIPLERAVPMWGGCSSKGFAPVLFHKTKKVSVKEWKRAVDKGAMSKALKALKSPKRNGRWLVLCDNESFLRAAAVSAAHENSGVTLWKIPPKSPDLNPVERFWGWLRKKLRSMDLADATGKRKALTKAQYTARVKRVLRSKKAQAVAAACAGGLRKVCQEVVAKKGAATSG